MTHRSGLELQTGGSDDPGWSCRSKFTTTVGSTLSVPIISLGGWTCQSVMRRLYFPVARSAPVADENSAGNEIGLVTPLINSVPLSVPFTGVPAVSS